MLRTHATFFEARPDGELLREHLSLATGFRLLRHIKSGVYLVESDDDAFDASAFSILNTKKIPQLKAIKSALKSEERAGRLEWGTYRPNDINDAIWLSDIFQTRVMVAYFDDDGGDMVSIGHCGQLERACINGSSIGEEGEESYEIEMLVPEATTYRKVERENWNDIFEREFKSVFGQAAPDLTDEERSEFEEVDSVRKQTQAKIPFKLIIILAIIVAALIMMLNKRTPQPKGSPVDKTSKKLEEVCNGELSSSMQDICNEFQRLEKERKSKSPK